MAKQKNKTPDTLSATELHRRLGDVLDDVYYRAHHVTITKNNTPRCIFISVEEYARLKETAANYEKLTPQRSQQ